MLLPAKGTTNAAIPLSDDVTDGCSGFGITACQNPVYQVAQYSLPAQYSPQTLWVVTRTMPDAYRETLYSLMDQETIANLGTPILLFTHVESTDSQDVRDHPYYWIPLMQGETIQRFYWIAQTEDGSYATAYSEDCAAKLTSLASKTNQEHPLYLVADGDVLYAVIDDTAYNLNDWGVESFTDVIPEIDTQGIAVTVEPLTHS